jgi:hypothetical protein
MTKRLILSAFVIGSAFVIRHSSLTAAAASPGLSLYLLGHKIGSEVSETTAAGDTTTLKTHFEYLDRGTKVALDSTITFKPDVTPLSFESHGKSYRYFAVDASVPKASGARSKASRRSRCRGCSCVTGSRTASRP